MDDSAKTGRVYSRRQFLRGVPLGIAGAFVATLVFNKLLPSALARRRRPPTFPEGSIFTPAQDGRHKIRI